MVTEKSSDEATTGTSNDLTEARDRLNTSTTAGKKGKGLARQLRGVPGVPGRQQLQFETFVRGQQDVSFAPPQHRHKVPLTVVVRYTTRNTVRTTCV